MSTDVTEDKNAQLQAKSPAIPARAEQDVTTPFTAHVPKLHKRSVGLRLFDLGLYNLTNIGVFAVSVALTYLSKHGGDRGAQGELLFGKIGEAIHKRTNPVRQFFRNRGCSEQSANDYTTVAFSFIDGTLFAPLVKLFEDRREKIAYWIDQKLGTTQDASVYEAEPKQTWGSVILGRVVTSAIVVPTALVLDKNGLNDKLFTKPGEKIAAYVEQSPSLRSMAPAKIDLPYASKIVAFEAFYTSICTLGLYFLSRLFARRHDAKQEIRQEHTLLTAPPATLALEAPAIAADPATPRLSVSQVHHEDRLAPALSQHITA